MAGKLYARDRKGMYVFTIYDEGRWRSRRENTDFAAKQCSDQTSRHRPLDVLFDVGNPAPVITGARVAAGCSSSSTKGYFCAFQIIEEGIQVASFTSTSTCHYACTYSWTVISVYYVCGPAPCDREDNMA
jgi:hypothetical protein